MTNRIRSLLGNTFGFLLGARNSPKGFLGINWGEDATEAAARLGLSCQKWEAWEGGQGYETCFDIDHPADAFGRKAYVRLFRNQNLVEGLSLRFMQCGAARNDLADAVRQVFMLKEAEGALYHIFRDGEVVRLSYDGSDDSCELTVAGPCFGKAFAGYLLREGFKNLGNELRPR